MSAPETSNDLGIPSDADAEMAVLGSCMLSTAALDDCLKILTPAMFYRPAHGDLFGVLKDLRERGAPTDTIAVGRHLGVKGAARLGGLPYLHTLIQGVVTAANAEYHAERVRDVYVRREGTYLSTRLAQMLRDHPDTEALDLIERCRTEFDDLAEKSHNRDGVYTSGEVFDEIMEEWSNPVAPGIPTGFYDLDEALAGGLKPSHVVLVAARPGEGKTIVACNIARHLASKQKRVMFFSLEMTRQELMTRMTADVGGVLLHNLHTHKLDDMDWEKVRRAQKKIHEYAPIKLLDAANVKLAQIRAIAREEMRKPHGLDVLIIDYLGLIGYDDEKMSDYAAVSRISRGVKLLAKELNIPILIIHQLNRGPESRPGRLPQLSDLRDSGKIEQDIDIAILLHHDKENEEDAGNIQFILAKNRHGPMLTLKFLWQAEYSRIANHANPDHRWDGS